LTTAREFLLEGAHNKGTLFTTQKDKKKDK